jgi:hypothetical protein
LSKRVSSILHAAVPQDRKGGWLCDGGYGRERTAGGHHCLNSIAVSPQAASRKDSIGPQTLDHPQLGRAGCKSSAHQHLTAVGANKPFDKWDRAKGTPDR